MLRARLRSGLAHTGEALREPERFALRWHDGEADYPWWVFAALMLTAMVGTLSYGATMGLLGGARDIVLGALLCTTAAGLAWGVALPSLYILNSLAGSRLRASTTFLAALVTTSWGGLAMIASIPVNWFFTVALADLVHDPAWLTWLVRAVNLVVFTGVGVSMTDIFGRVMRALEPDRGRWPTLWLGVVGAIGGELFYAFGLFQFSVIS